MNPLKAIVSHLPHAPGVYRFLNDKEEVLYVGKAIDLKKRVGSYFRTSKNQPIRLRKLLEHTSDIQFTVVDSELEALILETNLIKSYRPRYNILMKDDKSYVYVKITINEEFPRVYVARRLQKDGARYFGPKTSASGVRQILEALKKVFPYRHCDLFIDLRGKDTPQCRDRAFAEQHRKRCLGPCILEAPPEEYQHVVAQVVAFFEGKTELLMEGLKVQMQEAVQARAYERAAQLRDRIQLIEGLMDKQRVSAPDDFDRDVIGLAIEGGAAYVTVFLFRGGKLLSQENFVLSGVDFQSGAELQETEVLTAFMNQYYSTSTDIPSDILLPECLEDSAAMEVWLSTLAAHRVHVAVPERGKNRELLELAHQNARNFARHSQVRWQAGSGQDVEAALSGLRDLLNLPRLPQRIECYDISHLGGVDTVGSMVVFEKGFPKKVDYRHFKLRSVQQKIDDYQALEEVLTRRLHYLQNPGRDFRKPRKAELPQLVKILKKKGLDVDGLNVHKTLIFEKRKKIFAIGRMKPLEKERLPAPAGVSLAYKPLGDTRDARVCVSELCSLWVDPSLRGEMWGQKMVRALLAKQKKGKVYVVVGVSRLVDWYGALGFHEVNEVPPALMVKQATCTEKCGGVRSTVMVYRFSKEGSDSSFQRKPDLLIIDGGKGQLGAVVGALKQSELTIPVISLAKQEEEIFVPQSSESIRLSRDSDVLQLVQRLRDEAHRFALKYQRNLREKRMLS
jgi:excinuclease ABC subunit C